MNDGYVSVGQGLTTDSFGFIKRHDQGLTDEHLQAILDMSHTSPDSRIFANTYESNVVFTGSTDQFAHTNSFLSVVSETLYQSHISFFSEKIYKPLAIGHPFIVNGNPYSLRKLRDTGFKTFGQWWDESYDNIEDVTSRVHAIIDILKMLKALPHDRLREMRTEMISTLKHNQEVFNHLREIVRAEFPAAAIIRKHLYGIVT
jgi:hypothetical protein